MARSTCDIIRLTCPLMTRSSATRSFVRDREGRGASPRGAGIQRRTAEQSFGHGAVELLVRTRDRRADGSFERASVNPRRHGKRRAVRRRAPEYRLFAWTAPRRPGRRPGSTAPGAPLPASGIRESAYGPNSPVWGSWRLLSECPFRLHEGTAPRPPLQLPLRRSAAFNQTTPDGASNPVLLRSKKSPRGPAKAPTHHLLKLRLPYSGEQLSRRNDRRSQPYWRAWSNAHAALRPAARESAAERRRAKPS